MSSERIDPELLAAFLEGTASPEERESVLRTMAQSREAYANFLEASAVHRALELESSAPAITEAPPGPTISRRVPKRPRWLFPSLLIAAAIAGVVVLARLRDGATRGTIQMAQATRLTREVGPGALARQFGAAWDQPPWSTTRGTGESLAAAPTAFRAGARYADLEIASQAGDSVAAVRAAGALALLLQTVEAGAPLGESLRSLARSREPDAPAQRAAAAAQVRLLLGTGEWFDLGIWTETGRIAVLAREIRFFEPGGPGIAELRRIIESGTPAAQSVEWRAATDPLRPLVADRPLMTGDIESIDQAIRSAMVAAAR